MLLKYIYLITAFIAISLLTSCEDTHGDAATSPEAPYPIGKEYNVSVDIAPFLEVDEQPLSRSSATLPEGLYAVNVFWKGKGITSFQPYASGLFSRPDRIEIGLIEEYTYRFDCSFLGYENLPYHYYGEDKQYFGLPFSRSAEKQVDGFVTNDLLISIDPLRTNKSFHQCIYSGEMHMKKDSISTHPTVKRYFGSSELNFTTPDMSTFVSISLKRAYYSLQFATEELGTGDSIKVEANDISPFYLVSNANGKSVSDERLLSMHQISDSYTARLREEETVHFTISYRSASEGIWYPLYVNQGLTLKRNKKNIINIVNINEHVGDASLSFEEKEEMEEAGQELGK